MIVVAIYTCGRRGYLEETLASFTEQVSGPITRTVVFDDSGDAEYRTWLETLRIQPAGVDQPVANSVAEWGRNRGFTGSVKRSWMWLARHCVEPYVFHLEEDFTFDQTIDLSDLVAVLDAGDHLDQVALLRGPFFPREHRACCIVEQNPDSYTSRDLGGHAVLEHDQVFTTNPSMYRRTLCDNDWPDVKGSERAFTRQRVQAGRRFAYMGDGTPWCSHIGAERTGTGY